MLPSLQLWSLRLKDLGSSTGVAILMGKEMVVLLWLDILRSPGSQFGLYHLLVAAFGKYFYLSVT